MMWLFFFIMALPTAVLVFKSYDQLKWEAFYQHRLLAEELAGRIDQGFTQFVSAEQKRPFTHYQFAMDGLPALRSPLSNFPVSASTPGVIGYFQIDASGRFSTPLVPGPQLALPDMSYRFGLSAAELQQRLTTQQQIEKILSSNDLVDEQIAQEISPPAAVPAEQVAADYATEQDADAGLFSRSAPASAPQVAVQEARKGTQNQAAFDRLSEIKKSRVKADKTANDSDNVVGRLQELEQQSPYKEKVGRKQQTVQREQMALDDKAAPVRTDQNRARTAQQAKREADQTLNAGALSDSPAASSAVAAGKGTAADRLENTATRDRRPEKPAPEPVVVN
ncbi:MAG: hypothetical protein HKN70_09575, partial [Gammaproteobacteria bacterium]|nr:hypothetical protein [Gammaproteobacteria bacterium]